MRWVLRVLLALPALPAQSESPVRQVLWGPLGLQEQQESLDQPAPWAPLGLLERPALRALRVERALPARQEWLGQQAP